MTTSTTLEPTTTNEGFPERFIQVCPSDTFTLFLQASGDAWSCGNNQYGSLGIGRDISTQATPKIFARGVRKIGVGKDHAGFIDFQNRLHLWGNGWNGELGVDPQTISTDPENRFWSYPRRVRTSVVDFALGSNRTIFVTDDGRVFATGENTDGVLGTSSEEIALREFTQVEGLENITEVDAGINHFGAIDQDGALWTWGSNEFGKLGASSGTDTTIGARKVINGNVRSVSCGEDFTIATLENGRVLVAGKGKWGSVPFFFDIIGEPSRDYGLQEVWGTIDPDIAREMSIIYASQNEIILTLGAQYSFKFVPNLNGSFRDTKLGRIYFEYTAPNTGTDENPITRSIFTYLNVSFQETDYLVYEPEDFTLDGWGADGGDGIVLSYNVLQSTTSTTGEPTTTQEVTTTEEVTTSTSTTQEPTTTQEVTTSSTTSTSTTEEPTTSTSTSTTSTSTTEEPTTSTSTTSTSTSTTSTSTTEEPTTSTSTSTTSTSTTEEPTTSTSTSTTSTTTPEPNTGHNETFSDGLVSEYGGTKELEMIYCEPGIFTRGQNDISSATPEHEVTLTQGFYLGKYEVTQAQYEAVMTGNTDGLSATPSLFGSVGDRPVERVTWDNIQVFLDRLNTQEANNIPAGWAYALPTEAQWEYACRAGTTTSYSWGNSISASNANWNYGNDANRPIIVGQYSANPWGFYDMHGNVWEWTADAFANYITGAQTDPFNAGSTGSRRVIRGGGWTDVGSILQSANRSSLPPSDTYPDIGFRVALVQV